MPYFSVIIPLFNKQSHVAKAIDSVLNQDFTDFEIIVINDGSTDLSENEVLKFNDTRIKYFKTENRGVSCARNFGVHHANANFIAFLDADDYWFKSHLTEIYGLTFSFPDVGFYTTNYNIVSNGKKTLFNTFPNAISKTKAAIVDDFFEASLHSRIALTSATTVKKEVFNQLGGFNEQINFGEDLELWIRLALISKVAFNPKISVSYSTNTQNRLSDLSVSQRKFALLNQFANEELGNLSLKNFLDIYRAEFAIKHKLVGDKVKFNFYFKQICNSKLNEKTKLILKLPKPALKVMYFLKKTLEKNNILISIYN